MIYRNRNKTGNFTIVSNELFQDANVSAKAKGLYAFLMTLPDDWKVRKASLHQFFKDGRDGIISAFDELIELGYIKSEELRDAKGHVTWVHTVFETPDRLCRNGEPVSGKPESGESVTTKDSSLQKTKKEKTRDPAIAIAEIEFPDLIGPHDERLSKLWCEWVEHRRQAGSKITEIAARRQLKDLKKIGPDRAAAAIENSITKNYTGLYEPKQDGKPKKRELTPEERALRMGCQDD
jgi:hypothetical protein